MDASEKWIIFQFTQHQTTTLLKWMFSKTFLQKSLLLNGLYGIQIRPPNNNDDLYPLFCINPSSSRPNCNQAVDQLGELPLGRWGIIGEIPLRWGELAIPPWPTTV